MEDKHFVDSTKFRREMEILTDNFCAIFQSCKKASLAQTSETDWRSDHDRLLFDFFLRPLYPDVDQDSTVRAW